ncbi:MAG: DSD1 family PLP-dependent enzyme [Proteobacteria bacterium]|nr:DSD1 family PLP-dependent enzyme [Pseudomonadota bacterium]
MRPTVRPDARFLATTPHSLDDIETPALVLDVTRMERNIERLKRRLTSLGVAFRPHVKTAKSIDVAERLLGGRGGPITVSTLKEAEYFAGCGITDMTYAVGLAPAKIARVQALHVRGLNLSVLIDTPEQAHALVAAARSTGGTPGVLIEIDCDGHRGGVRPDDPQLPAIAAVLRDGGVELRGVLTHAGESYSCRGGAGLPQAAEAERAGAVRAAERLRALGHPASVVSVGSTPTVHFAQDLSGVTEVRAGVFVFFDLVMHGIGVCAIDDIALSVLATVIGHRAEKGWLLIDAGWMALSRDRGTARHPIDQGYGVVCDVEGQPLGDLIVSDASQEHGIVSVRPGSDSRLPDLPIGTRVRILPNHACATGAQHDSYQVVRSGSRDVVATWPRMRGW